MNQVEIKFDKGGLLLGISKKDLSMSSTNDLFFQFFYTYIII